MKPVVHVVNTASCYRVLAPFYIVFKSAKMKIVSIQGSYVEETVSMPEDTVRVMIKGLDGALKEELIPYHFIQSMHHGNGTLFWRQ